MKKIVLIAIALITATSASFAQSKDQNIWLGPFFTAGGAVNAGSVANGAKTDFKFAWSGGASALFGITDLISAQVDMGYDARSLDFYKQDDQNFKYSYTFNYFAIRPSILLGDFQLGLGLGVPLGYSADTMKGAGQPTGSFSVGATAMNFLVELRLGATIPIWQNDDGQLRFLVQGSYAFSHLVSDANAPLPYFDPKQSHNTSDNNGPVATASFGVSYLFNLTKH